MAKTTIRTVLNNVTQLQDGTWSYKEDLVWSKWIAETNTQPQPLVSVVQEHFSDDLNSSDSTSQRKVSSDQPTNKKRVH